MSTTGRRTSVTTNDPAPPLIRSAAAVRKLLAPDEPQHPRFADLQDRLNSFNNDQWPLKCPVRPEELAAAGFYYFGSFEGINDSVKCFHCDAGLCLWEKGDVPWTEHKRVAPSCWFVKKFHPDVLKEEELEKLREQKEAARDPNEVVDDWMTGLMVVQFMEKHNVSRNQMRNILHKRWLNKKTPFARKEELQDAVAAATESLIRKFGQLKAVYSDKREIRNAAVNQRSKTCVITPTSDSSDEIESGSSQESVSSSSSQSSTSSYSSSSSGCSSGDEDNCNSRLLCKVCLDRQLEVVFIPCGHFVCCSTCSQSLNKCPYCRKVIASAVKTYLS